MAVTLALAYPIVANYLNATTTARNATTLSTTVDDDRHSRASIESAILDADGEVCRAIINAENHPRRNAFVSKVEVTTYGANLPECTDGYTSVEVYGNDNIWRMGVSRDVRQIERIRRLPGVYGNTTGSQLYFNTSNGNAYFTGQKIRFDTYTYVRGSDCQSPDEFLTAVIYLALGALMAKEGDNPAAAAYYRDQGMTQIQMIMQNDSPTEFEAYQSAKARGAV